MPWRPCCLPASVTKRDNSNLAGVCQPTRAFAVQAEWHSPAPWRGCRACSSWWSSSTVGAEGKQALHPAQGIRYGTSDGRSSGACFARVQAGLRRGRSPELHRITSKRIQQAGRRWVASQLQNAWSSGVNLTRKYGCLRFESRSCRVCSPV